MSSVGTCSFALALFCWFHHVCNSLCYGKTSLSFRPTWSLSRGTHASIKNKVRSDNLSVAEVEEMADALGQYVGTTKASWEMVMGYDNPADMRAAMSSPISNVWATTYVQPAEGRVPTSGLHMCELTRTQFLETKKIPHFFNFSNLHHGTRSSLGRRSRGGTRLDDQPHMDIPSPPAQSLRFGHIVDTQGTAKCSTQYLDLHHGGIIASLVVPAMMEFIASDTSKWRNAPADANRVRWQVIVW